MKKNTYVYLYVTPENNKTVEFLAAGLIVREPIDRYNKIFQIKIIEINPIDSSGKENSLAALALLNRVFPRNISNFKTRISKELWQKKVRNQIWLSLSDKKLIPHSKP